MSGNPITCSNCGTENPSGQDFCVRCNQPLTGSADEALRENLEAQARGGLFGAGGTAMQGSGLDAGVMGGGGGSLLPADPGQGLVDTPIPSDPTQHEGLPPRRS
jgi:hypothetical protein